MEVDSLYLLGSDGKLERRFHFHSRLIVVIYRDVVLAYFTNIHSACSSPVPMSLGKSIASLHHSS